MGLRVGSTPHACVEHGVAFANNALSLTPSLSLSPARCPNAHYLYYCWGFLIPIKKPHPPARCTYSVNAGACMWVRCVSSLFLQVMVVNARARVA